MGGVIGYKALTISWSFNIRELSKSQLTLPITNIHYNLKESLFILLLDLHEIRPPWLLLCLIKHLCFIGKPFELLKWTNSSLERHRRYLSKFLIKIAQSQVPFDLRKIERLISLMIDIVPVNIIEPWMLHNLVNSLRAQSLSRVFNQQSLDELFGQIREIIWIGRLGVFYLLKQLSSVLCIKWRNSDKHLINDASESPPIDCFSIGLFVDYLWGQVLWSATDGSGFIQDNVHPWETKVCYLDITIGSDENVLRLQVPVYDVFRMKVLQGQDQLAGVESCVVFRESLHFGEEVEELSSGTVL